MKKKTSGNLCYGRVCYSSGVVVVVVVVGAVVDGHVGNPSIGVVGVSAKISIPF